MRRAINVHPAQFDTLLSKCLNQYNRMIKIHMLVQHTTLFRTNIKLISYSNAICDE